MPSRTTVMMTMVGLALLASSSLLACQGDSREAGMRAVEREAEEEARRLAKSQPAAPKQRPPVQGSRKIDCTQLIDMPAFREALGEKEPLAMRDVSKGNAEANSSCSLLRGGRIPTAKEQDAIIKRNGKLGVLAGDELCNISAYCNTIEADERFKKRCAELKMEGDESMGSFACVKIIKNGPVDVRSFRFLDAETKCVIEVRGGPSMTDTDFITRCAKAARDLIGPAQIAETPPAAAAEGSAEGAAGSGSPEGGAADEAAPSK